MAIGSITGFICSLFQDVVRRGMNKEGVIDSNSALFTFLVPSLFAAIFSAVVVGIDKSYNTTTAFQFTGTPTPFTTTLNYGPNIKPGRGSTAQGGYMIVGWCLSVAFGLLAGGLIGLLYRLLDDRSKSSEFFSDLSVYEGPSRRTK